MACQCIMEFMKWTMLWLMFDGYGMYNGMFDGYGMFYGYVTKLNR